MLYTCVGRNNEDCLDCTEDFGFIVVSSASPNRSPNDSRSSDPRGQPVGSLPRVVWEDTFYPQCHCSPTSFNEHRPAVMETRQMLSYIQHLIQRWGGGGGSSNTHYSSRFTSTETFIRDKSVHFIRKVSNKEETSKALLASSPCPQLR